MNENLNLVEILKGCPKGTKLYSSVYGEVQFERINNYDAYPIEIKVLNKITNPSVISAYLVKDGRCTSTYDGECTLFPSKDQRDWSKFKVKNEELVPPCEFKDGDILSYQCGGLKNRTIYIYRYHERFNTAYYVALSGDVNETFRIDNKRGCALNGYNDTARFATEEEKQKLFDAIKLNGYKWNSETKTLEKLIEPKFKVGDWLCANELNDYANNIKIVNIVDVFGKKRYKISRDYDSDLDLVEFNFIEEHYHLWTIQDAKDGDVLVNGSNIFIFYFINNRRLMGYCHVNMNDGNFYNDIGRIECFCTIDAPVTPATKEQRNALMKAMNDAGYVWDAEKKELRGLIKPKFDPKTLQPFARVLVKEGPLSEWTCTFFSHMANDVPFPIYCSGGCFKVCIPYNIETKPLVGTLNDCPDYYKWWEK